MLKNKNHSGNIHHKKRASKGASVVFALVGFMFSAMISMIVVSLAYSNATKNRKQQYEQQSFILAQNMAAIITDAIAGEDDAASPFAADADSTSTSGLTVGIQRIDESIKNDADAYEKIVLYNPDGVTASGNVTFVTAATDKANLNYSIIDGKADVSNNGKELRKVIRGMATKILRGETVGNQKLETTMTDSTTGITSKVTATLKMDASYTLTAEVLATTQKGSVKGAYRLDLTAYATVGSTPGNGFGVIEEDGEGTGKYKSVVTLGSVSTDITKKTMKVLTDNVKWQTNQIKIDYVSVAEGG